MTLHLVGLPHTETTAEYLSCAYTQKVVRFCQMMQGHGRTITLYAGEHNEALCDEHVPLVSRAEQDAWFGPWDPNASVLRANWDRSHVSWLTYNQRAIEAIADRYQPGDLILITGGNCQQAITAALPAPQYLACEWTVGYEGTFTDFCAFESTAWRHHVYGLQGRRHGRFYDAVIPNFFDPRDFYLGEKKGYLLFLGRLIPAKGVGVAVDIAQELGRELLIAGPGATAVSTDADGITTIVGSDGLTVAGKHLTYVGPVNRSQRARLLSEAAAVLMPTLYLEPFGGVAVEAMLSGTPAITTDFGAFTETVQPGLTGYRFTTLQEAIEATEAATYLLSPARIRRVAEARFGLEPVGIRFEQWFSLLDGLWGEGWTARKSSAFSGSGVHSAQPVNQC